ncbi:hypothetical protein ACFV27_35330 [Streptomyces antimycoticus]|uniref:hypothetical protein n=1 Tax=Streptomyces antimycoticus TaxID=68175 RepID=UPI00368E5AE3
MDTVVFTATYADIPAHLPVPGTFRELLSAAAASSGEMVHAHIERPPLHSGGRR